MQIKIPDHRSVGRRRIDNEGVAFDDYLNHLRSKYHNCPLSIRVAAKENGIYEGKTVPGGTVLSACQKTIFDRLAEVKGAAKTSKPKALAYIST